MSARDTGLVRQIICTAVAQGRASTVADLRRSLRNTLGGSQVDEVVVLMIREGLVVRMRGGTLRVTPLGGKLVPSVQQPFARTTYAPPAAPPRRPGSMDFAQLPSIAAGEPRSWRHPT